MWVTGLGFYPRGLMGRPFVLFHPNHLFITINQMPTMSKSLFQVLKALFWKDSLSGQWPSELEEGWQGEDGVEAGPAKQVQEQHTTDARKQLQYLQGSPKLPVRSAPQHAGQQGALSGCWQGWSPSRSALGVVCASWPSRLWPGAGFCPQHLALR